MQIRQQRRSDQAGGRAQPRRQRRRPLRLVLVDPVRQHSGRDQICSSALDSLLAVYTGSAVNGSDTGCEQRRFRRAATRPAAMCEFNATAGTTYRIAVDGKNGAQGNFRLELSGAPANDDFANARDDRRTASAVRLRFEHLAGKQARRAQPRRQPRRPLDLVLLDPRRQRPGRDLDLPFNGLDTLLAVYTGVAVNSLTPVPATTTARVRPQADGDSEVAFTAVAGTTYRIAVDGKDGAAGLDSAASLKGRPANDDLAGAEVVGARTLPGSSLGLEQARRPRGRRAQPRRQRRRPLGLVLAGPPRAAGRSKSRPAPSRQLDTLLGVYTGTAVNSLTPVASNDDAGGCKTTDSASNSPPPPAPPTGSPSTARTAAQAVSACNFKAPPQRRLRQRRRARPSPSRVTPTATCDQAGRRAQPRRQRRRPLRLVLVDAREQRPG